MLRCEAETSNISQTVFTKECGILKKKVWVGTLMLLRIINVSLAKVRKVSRTSKWTNSLAEECQIV
jgi:hypothetical protein